MQLNAALKKLGLFISLNIAGLIASLGIVALLNWSKSISTLPNGAMLVVLVGIPFITLYVTSLLGLRIHSKLAWDDAVFFALFSATAFEFLFGWMFLTAFPWLD